MIGLYDAFIPTTTLLCLVSLQHACQSCCQAGGGASVGPFIHGLCWKDGALWTFVPKNMGGTLWAGQFGRNNSYLLCNAFQVQPTLAFEIPPSCTLSHCLQYIWAFTEHKKLSQSSLNNTRTDLHNNVLQISSNKIKTTFKQGAALFFAKFHGLHLEPMRRLAWSQKRAIAGEVKEEEIHYLHV